MITPRLEVEFSKNLALSLPLAFRLGVGLTRGIARNQSGGH